MLTACGSEDKDKKEVQELSINQSKLTISIGTFIHTTVQGLHYKTAIQVGYTDINGNFK
ncbi:MAG: hypothetical protein HRT40_11150 [Campylobacteraceae bacterium]|nr:hypothetical protein [Campylobacteraceae bacterium]